MRSQIKLSWEERDGYGSTPWWEAPLLFVAVMLVHMHHQTLFKGGSWVGMIPRMGMVHKPAEGGPIRVLAGLPHLFCFSVRKAERKDPPYAGL